MYGEPQLSLDANGWEVSQNSARETRIHIISILIK